MIRYKIPAILLLLSSITLNAQDTAYARNVLNHLAGEDFFGRGYVKEGDARAAEYIAGELRHSGLRPVDSSYFQNYTFPINTFPGKIALKLDGKKLQPGTEYTISSSTGPVKGKFSLYYLDDSIDSREKLISFVEERDFSDRFLVTKHAFRKLYGETIPNTRGMVVLTDKIPYWHVSNGGQVDSTCWVKVWKPLFSGKPESLSIDVKNEFIAGHPARNVIAMVEGKTNPDRYIAITAHYDHLGMMGKRTWYPGANDNGSGTAMMLDLARHFARPENQPGMSMVFMAFSGEEAGLHGSEYYVENPLFRLERIELLINLDMVGTGSEGITIVNSLAYKSLYDKMVAINEEKHFVPAIKERGESCNSDHCPFYKKGVKSIFIYTMGDEHKAYHTPDDLPENVPFTAYSGLFKLIGEYLATLE